MKNVSRHSREKRIGGAEDCMSKGMESLCGVNQVIVKGFVL